MEILSTGEKIKRARVYKGITLKELCGERISISKMSCIENGKIKAEADVLKYISEKINIDYDYLIRDVYEQVEDNLKIIRGSILVDKDIERKITMNLDCAVEYGYYDMAFELIHLLFTHYLNNSMYENIQLIVSQYFDLFQRKNNEENTIIYYKDMAQYLFQNEEYNEAISYYNRLKETLMTNNNTDSKLYCLLSFNEGICYSKIKDNNKAYELLKKSIESIGCIQDELTIGKIYNAFAVVCIRTKRAEGEMYIKKAYEYQKENPLVLATSMGEYAATYFEVKNINKAISEIKAGVQLFPKHNKLQYAQFLNNCIKILFDNDQYDYAFELTDEALNLAIETDNVRLIERAYYFKGTILQRQENYYTAEMYMNLSIDALFKFGSKEERYRRYLDMANLYYNLDDTKESLKYFNLALNIQENM